MHEINEINYEGVVMGNDEGVVSIGGAGRSGIEGKVVGRLVGGGTV